MVMQECRSDFRDLELGAKRRILAGPFLGSEVLPKTRDLEASLLTQQPEAAHLWANVPRLEAAVGDPTAAARRVLGSRARQVGLGGGGGFGWVKGAEQFIRAQAFGDHSGIPQSRVQLQSIEFRENGQGAGSGNPRIEPTIAQVADIMKRALLSSWSRNREIFGEKRSLICSWHPLVLDEDRRCFSLHWPKAGRLRMHAGVSGSWPYMSPRRVCSPLFAHAVAGPHCVVRGHPCHKPHSSRPSLRRDRRTSSSSSSQLRARPRPE